MAKTSIAEFREKSGLTQSELAEKLNVTRQTVSSWETGRTEPDIESLTRIAEIFDTDMNELTGFAKAPEAAVKKPPFTALLIVSAVLCTAFTVFADADTEIKICLIVLFLCSVYTVIPLAVIANSGDFTMLAGYDPKNEYNSEEMKKMLYSMCFHISVGTLAFSAIYPLCMILCPSEQLSVVLTIAYILDFTLAILITSFKYSKKVCKKEAMPQSDRKLLSVSLPYAVLIMTQSIALSLRCAFYENISHASATIFCFGAAIAETVWLFYEYVRRKKYKQDDYAPRKKPQIAIIAIGIICTALIFVKF